MPIEVANLKTRPRHLFQRQDLFCRQPDLNMGKLSKNGCLQKSLRGVQGFHSWPTFYKISIVGIIEMKMTLHENVCWSELRFVLFRLGVTLQYKLAAAIDNENKLQRIMLFLFYFYYIHS